MEKRMSMIFHARKSKATKGNLVPIYLRVTIGGQRCELTTKQLISEEKWSAHTGKVKGTSAEAKAINSFLDTLQGKAHAIHRAIIQEGKSISIELFKDRWFGIAEKPVMLMEVFQEHNDKMEKLVGQDYAYGTFQRYQTSLQHTRDFLMWKFKENDIDLKKLNFKFITDYEFYLKSVRKCGHNSTMKYLANFKKIVLICVKNDWLEKDPFFAYKMHKHDVDRTALTEKELSDIVNKRFAADRLNQVRDIFIFCCYTGLAYADVHKLKRSEIVDGIDGGKWLLIKRQKTESRSSIPILPTAMDLLKRYQDHPQCVNKGQLLPVLSNQKMNSYLKEIADQCGISKTITFHLARHTFATTITLSNGVPIESVSKMLGHRDLKTTQLYAKVVDKKISDDMNKLKELLGSKQP